MGAGMGVGPYSYTIRLSPLRRFAAPPPYRRKRLGGGEAFYHSRFFPVSGSKTWAEEPAKRKRTVSPGS